MKTFEGKLLGIGIFCSLLLALRSLSLTPSATALGPNLRAPYVRGGSTSSSRRANNNRNEDTVANTMSADEQPQGLNGMDLVIDGELLGLRSMWDFGSALCVNRRRDHKLEGHSQFITFLSKVSFSSQLHCYNMCDRVSYIAVASMSSCRMVPRTWRAMARTGHVPRG